MVARGLTVALLIAACWAALGVAGSATASAMRCTYDGAGRVDVVVDGPGPDATLSVARGGAILADGRLCGAATVTNTDTIRVTGVPGSWSQNVKIDLSGGPFAPGRTDEPGTSDEIEFALFLTELPMVTVSGGPGPDHVVAGAAGINLNAAEPFDDVDLTYMVEGSFGNALLDQLLGNGGDDILSNAGGEGTGAAWPFSTALIGGGIGKDRLFAGVEDARLVGGPDDDVLVGGPDDGDTLLGGSGGDRLLGKEGDDELDGGEASDNLFGGSGDDTLIGGPGIDGVSGNSDDDVLQADDDERDTVNGGLDADTADVDRPGDGSPAVDSVSDVEVVT
jgi:Ca2+-binding RTX toxin-like protein